MSDSNLQESVQEQTAEDNAVCAASELPGRRLRETRENNHLSREEVAHHLRLDAELIQALEQDEYSHMPSPAYICGYLRSYARLLKLPENEIVQAYSHGEQINAELIPSSVNIQPAKSMNVPLVKTVVIVIVIALIGGGIYFLIDKYKIFSGGLLTKQGTQTVQQGELLVPPAPTKPEPADHAATPTVDAKAPAKPTADTKASVSQSAAPAKPVATDTVPAHARLDTGITTVEKLPTPKNKIPAEEPDTATGQSSPPASDAAASKTTATQSTQAPGQTAALRMHFNGDSWVEVTDATNKHLVYHLIEKGSDLNLDGVPPFTILLGNASAVQVFYKGKEFDHSNYRPNQVAIFKVGAK